MNFLSKSLKAINPVYRTQSVVKNQILRAMSSNITGNVIGIDLGTTNSCVAVMEV